MHDPSKRCGDCFFWTSADGKTGVCAVLCEDDSTPFTPPASGCCTEHRVSTKSADRLKRQVLELQGARDELLAACKAAIAELKTTVIQKDAYIAGQKESVIYLGREISLRDRRIAELKGALLPFAEEFNRYRWDTFGDGVRLHLDSSSLATPKTAFTVGDLRRATKLLSEEVRENLSSAECGTPPAPSEALIIEGFKTGRPNPGQWIAAREPIKLQVICNAIDNVFEVAHPGPFGLLSATEKLADLRTAVESELAYLWRDYALAEDGSLTDAARTLKGELLAAFTKADS